MATYAIGDIQGCFTTLQRLLQRAGVTAQDRLWLVGDLVNRGPHSLQVLRWARSLPRQHVLVLGNHDLRLLGRAEGQVPPDARDTLDEVLDAPDRDLLLSWLRALPFVHREHDHLLVHAGLLPAWTAQEALEQAQAASQALRRGQVPAAAEILTTLRFCDPAGSPRRGISGPPESAPPDAIPWFDHPARRSRDVAVVCGHWAALGLRLRPDLLALDTGCVWGGPLTALRLEDRAVFQEPKAAEDGPAPPRCGAATAAR
ncbi:MAG: diadenosine tetraphosphatase [Planctomycetota bacterium]|nr:MAG: diadenosine tetraphosphatase [Planctomycetota bacterium]